MTDDPSYRLYLEERFNGLHTSMNAQFDATHEKLESIEKQTIKTNGRVSIIEAWRAEHCGEELGSVKVIKSNQTKMSLYLKTAMFIIATIGLCLTAYFSYTGSKASKNNAQKIENLGEPVLINPRGGTIALPEEFTLKMFGRVNDSAKIIKK